MINAITFSPIAKVSSPYKEKFAIPRQPGLVSEAKGQLLLLPPYNQESYVRGLEQMTHIWVLFVFDQHLGIEPKALVRPPRLGGNKKIGVFASRSTFRPNPIGLSVLQLEGITCKQAQWSIDVCGLDLLDGTPVLDIKPYIPYADCISEAQSGYAMYAPEPLSITFEASAEQAAYCRTAPLR